LNVFLNIFITEAVQ